METLIRDPQVGARVWDRSGHRAAAPTYELQWIIFTCVLLVVDSLAVAAGLYLAFGLRITSGILTYTAHYDTSTYTILTALSIGLWLGLFAAYGLYRRDNLLGGILEYQNAFKACTTGIVILIIVSFSSHDVMVVSRVWLLLSWALTAIFVIVMRSATRRIAYKLRRHGWFSARVLIVGANDQGVAMAEQWRNSKTSGMDVIGFVDDFKQAGTLVLDGLKVVGHPTELPELIRSMGANEVVLVPNAVAWETFEEIISQNAAPKNYKLRLSPGFYGLLTTSVAVTNKTFVPLFSINEARLVGVDATLKALLDYGLTAILLIVTLPLQGLIALLIKMQKRSEPVLSRFSTIGQGGSMFNMLKFNTHAATNAARSGSTAWWLDRFIYAKGLDKLPQLFNILAGHMSLIGPRPVVLCGDDDEHPGAYSLRAVKPGVFGPWLVHEFWSSDESQDELYYVRNWTFWMDLQILAQVVLLWLRIKRTVPAPRLIN